MSNYTPSSVEDLQNTVRTAVELSPDVDKACGCVTTLIENADYTLDEMGATESTAREMTTIYDERLIESCLYDSYFLRNISQGAEAHHKTALELKMK